MKGIGLRVLCGYVHGSNRPIHTGPESLAQHWSRPEPRCRIEWCTADIWCTAINLTLMLRLANLANTKSLNDAKNLKNDCNPGTWVLIWDYSVKAFHWIPTWQGLDFFQKSLRLCDLDKSSLIKSWERNWLCRQHAKLMVHDFEFFWAKHFQMAKNPVRKQIKLIWPNGRIG